MHNKLIIKSFLVLCIFLFALYTILPNSFDSKFLVSKKRINLGLDLKGGSSLLLNVDLNFFFKEKLNILATEIKESLLTKNIESRVQRGRQVVVALTNVDDYKRVSILIHKINPNLELNRKGTSVFVSYKPHYRNSLINEVVSRSISNIQKRLDRLGTREVSIQKQGQNNILVQVPGVEDIEQIKSLLGKTAKLSFHLANTKVAKMKDIDHETTIILKDTLGNSYPIFRKTEIGGDSLVNVSVRFGHLGKPTVHFKFDGIASKRFAKITKKNVGKPFAIVLDNTVLTMPIIREPILNGEGEISGNFTERQASELAILLKSGALPAPLKIIEEKNIGPSLGEESIKAGEIAAIISITAVALFIIIIYGKLGLLASAALLFDVISILLILTLLEATLTLPGIAGIALTVGMSVDANVLIFERIREEIRSGKRTARAIEEGFKSAIKTILDSNITTLIAAGVMFVIGSGAIRGFSVTLSVGILCSMFSAIIVTKLLMELCVNPKKLVL
ncbi:protein translocase subunit SecD [Wolbachia endosymbiont of Dirofilaria (Dirofilaria) immitis]|uniref:protein translocase subunit SecD n=1 Tax=Wolbachia endosymbiont of Dirofilaria (Dirofilaria) immitis TaxID=1812115 RepID=UPI001589C54C|nr:protein translocase subunit SecD [Wolbachia endosymbiont of Dirofilaria (Dirofilaria) immitis]QKX02236.1 protein translocase subunit SecD [Wolbachia endosymbiont of Dirofilaria (Dirofilaria) immitis]